MLQEVIPNTFSQFMGDYLIFDGKKDEELQFLYYFVYAFRIK